MREGKLVLHIFGLGRVQRLPDGNLKNCVFEEPAYLVRLLETAESVLKALAAGKELSADFIEDIDCQCLENTTVWLKYFTRFIRDKSMWEYRGEGNVGFGLTDINWSEEGFKELHAKFACRTGGSKRDNRYLNGHPVGDLCDKDPRIMKREKQYFSRLLQDKDGPKYANIFINKLNEEIKASDNDDQKLDAIVHCCQDLFQAHLLRDGNTRIIAGHVLNFLLLKHGLRPAILEENDKIFAFFSFEEAKQFVIKGQEAFSRLMESGAA